MSIKIRNLVEKGAGLEARIIIIDSRESWLAFQQLVQNGSGLYPDLSAEIKTFADEVTVGHALQTYTDNKPIPITATQISTMLTESDS